MITSSFGPNDSPSIDWYNGVGAFVFDLFGAANSAAAARSVLGLGSMSLQSANAVAITGGTLNGVAVGGSAPAPGTFQTLDVTTPGSSGTSVLNLTGATALADARIAVALAGLLPTKGDLLARGVSVTHQSVGSNSTVLMANSASATGLTWGTLTQLFEANPEDDVDQRGAIGDILVRTETEYARMPVGANGTVMVADSSRPQGIRWSQPGVTNIPLTTKGDLLTYTTALARLAVGTDGQTLVADSSTPSGLRWAAGGGQAPIQFYDQDEELLGTAGTVTDLIFFGSGVTTQRVGNGISVNIAGGAGFPLSKTAYSDKTPTAIAWTSGSFPAAEDTRVRGTTYEGDNGRIWTMEAYLNGDWREAMALRRPLDQCNIPYPEIFIPNLRVNDLQGVSFVETLSTGVGLKNNGDSVNANIILNAPQASRSTTLGPLSTAQTYVSSSAFTIGDVTTGSTFRITAYGTCSSSSADTVTFRVKFGNNGNTADADIATLGTNSAGSGSNVPFKLEIICTVYQAASSIGIIETTASLINGGATGTQGVWVNPSAVFTPQQTTNLNTSVTSTRLGLSAQTSANSTTLIFHSVMVESVR